LGQQIAIYCRVSAIGQSFERQEWELKSYAAKAGFEVAGVWKEVASGSDDQRPERKKVMVLAQKRVIDAILVTELTRWGRSTFDLVQTLHDLDGWNVSLIAQTGLQFDLKTPQGKLFASLMAAMSEFGGIYSRSVFAPVLLLQRPEEKHLVEKLVIVQNQIDSLQR